jgi:hypothetical protein
MHPREREWLAAGTSKSFASPKGEGFPSSPEGIIKDPSFDANMLELLVWMFSSSSWLPYSISWGHWPI